MATQVSSPGARRAPLDDFLGAVCRVLEHGIEHGSFGQLGVGGGHGDDAAAGDTARAIADRLNRPAGSRTGAAPADLPVCRRHLGPALARALATPEPFAALATALQALSPTLSWRCRAPSPADDPAFRDHHANTWITGPLGLDRRDDVLVGASLLAPHTSYPLHHHPPSEIYAVLSDGEWFTPSRGWYRPGSGAFVHHTKNLPHAMRAGGEPLLAVWCLLPDGN